MINKSNSLALETTTKSLDGNMDIILSKISSRLDSVKGLAVNSHGIVNEIKNFIQRNSLVVSKNKSGKVDVHFCCNCLKAHLKNVAKKRNIDENASRILCAILHCQTGHGGYYIDANKLIKI